MKKIWVGIAIMLLLLSAGTALADHHDEFVDACRGKTITQGEEGAQKTSASHGKEAYAGRDVSFVDLPDGGFIAVWNDVTVLDDAGTANGITAHVRDDQTGGSSCVVAGEELRSLAQEAASAGSRKTLVINRGANGEIESLSLGHVHTFEEASGVVSLGQTAEGSGQILNYIAGFQMGSGQSGAQALNGLLTRGSEGHSTPFDLNIPESLFVTGHIYIIFDHFTEELLGLRFKVTPFSFFQTNSYGAEVLYETARKFLTEKNDRCGIVYDLYCGTGTIAQLMAPFADKVIGVEIVEEAVEAARENAKRNGLSNCEFIAGDVLKVLDGIDEKPDTIILDPPRDGIHPKALPRIIAYGVENILYISCKPTSLARDLPAFIAAGYRPVRGMCVNQFPWTSSVETVVLLSCMRFYNRKQQKN